MVTVYGNKAYLQKANSWELKGVRVAEKIKKRLKHNS